MFFKKNKPQYSYALIFSMLLHIGIFSTIVKSIHNSGTAVQQNSRFTHQKLTKMPFDSVKIISRQQLQAIKDNKNRQIVANELNGKKEKPKESRFAGEADQTFDRQTMAATNGAFKKAGLGNKQGLESIQNQLTEPASAPKKLSQAKKVHEATPKTLSLSDLGTIKISKIEEDQKSENNALEEMNRKFASQIKTPSGLGLEKGSAETNGLARNNDFVEEVPLGDMTNLNTTEFKYYGFYHRIRQKLEQYWGSTIQSKAKNLYKTGRRLPASENLITAIAVTLDDKGNIVDIKIEGTSGIRELDQAAIESFNKAGPFPNPPKGMLIGGRAVIQWGFVVKS
jgi:TonB family protein